MMIQFDLASDIIREQWYNTGGCCKIAVSHNIWFEYFSKLHYNIVEAPSFVTALFSQTQILSERFFEGC